MSDGIVAKGVTKKFGSNVVLDDLCVTMESGLIHGLLGNNGVGKSVLLKCICALLPIDAGIISVNGQHMKVGKPAVPTLGVVMEQTNFIPNLSGYKNLTYLITGKRRCGNELAKQAMEMVGLNAKSKIPVSQYSLGMRQCLAIAQAIMEEP